MSKNGTNPKDVLLVDASDTVLRQVRRALIESDSLGHLHTVGAPEEAIAYLRKDVPYRAALTPDVVVIGEKTPESRRCRIARELRDNPRLKHTELLAVNAPAADGSFSTRCCGMRPARSPQLANLLRDSKSPSSSAVDAVQES